MITTKEIIFKRRKKKLAAYLKVFSEDRFRFFPKSKSSKNQFLFSLKQANFGNTPEKMSTKSNQNPLRPTKNFAAHSKEAEDVVSEVLKKRKLNTVIFKHFISD